MEKCDFCHFDMVEKHVYTKYNDIIGEMITVNNVVFYECEKCRMQKIDSKIALDKYMHEVQLKIEEWLFKKIQLPGDVERYFYTFEQALQYIYHQSSIVKCDDLRFDKEFIDKYLECSCFHIRIDGKLFFLKSSIQRYCDGKSSEWKFSEGYHDEECMEAIKL